MCKDKIITVSGEVIISTLLRSILELSIQKESLIYLRISQNFNARPKRKLSIPLHELTNNCALSLSDILRNLSVFLTCDVHNSCC